MPDDAPLALTLAGPRGLVLHAVNAAAEAAGMHAGMALADARALLPSLATRPADPGGDAAALDRLARWCGRYSPWVRADGEDGILIDASGCAHLFACPEQGRRSGEAAMLDDIATRLEGMGLEVRAAIADTPGAAHAMARHGRTRVVPPGGSGAALAPLPVAALRIDDGAATTLGRLGLKRIGDLYDLPRATLARRFGHGGARAVTAVLHRLDQALGTIFEPVEPMMPAPAFRVRRALPEPLTETMALDALLAPLFAALAARLADDGKGARRLSVTLFRVDGTSTRLAAGANAPSRDPAHLARLFRERLIGIDPGFGIDCLILAADVVAPLGAVAQDFDGRGAQALALSELVDRLALRLGAAHIGHARPAESHVPERAERRGAGLDAPAWTTAERPPGPRRPLRLLPRPEPLDVMAEVPEGPPLAFRWRRVHHRVARAQGPERIAPEWWHDDGAHARVRDYYRVEDEAGRRFWLFRAGLYGEAAEHGAPRWFLHGLFA